MGGLAAYHESVAGEVEAHDVASEKIVADEAVEAGRECEVFDWELECVFRPS